MKNSNHKKSRISSSILLRMLSYSVILLFSYSVMHSCDCIYDNVEKYVDGEIVYIDKLDGVLKVQIGYERVEIDLLEAGRIPASQIRMAKAKKTVIECPDFTETGHRRVIDSICSWVNITGLTQSKYYEFTIYTEDEFGSRSLPLTANVRPYTAENLNSIEITPPSINASSAAAQIEWTNGISALTHKVVNFEWKYTDRDGVVCTDGDEGDKPVIFLENVAAEKDIPVELKCRLIPTTSNPDHTYTPIIDTVDFQQIINFRLSSSADEVIFLKTPIPGIDNDLTEGLPVAFTWTKTNTVNSYTLKFSLSPSFPDEGTYLMNLGDVNEYVMDNASMLTVVNSLNTKLLSEVYWTVTPTVQSAQVKTSYRLLIVWKAGVFYKYDTTDWLGVSASSSYSGTDVQYILNDNPAQVWHSSATALPHWLIVDMRTPKNIFKFDVYRQAGSLSDTKSMVFYISDNPDESGTWTKIGEGGFSPSTTGSSEPSCEVLMTDRVTKGRYFRIEFLDGRPGANPYVNVAILHIYYQ